MLLGGFVDIEIRSIEIFSILLGMPNYKYDRRIKSIEDRKG